MRDKNLAFFAPLIIIDGVGTCILLILVECFNGFILNP